MSGGRGRVASRMMGNIIAASRKAILGNKRTDLLGDSIGKLLGDSNVYFEGDKPAADGLLGDSIGH